MSEDVKKNLLGKRKEHFEKVCKKNNKELNQK